MTIADSLNQLKMQMKTELTERQNEFLMYGYGIVPILNNLNFPYEKLILLRKFKFSWKKCENFQIIKTFNLASPKSIK